MTKLNHDSSYRIDETDQTRPDLGGVLDEGVVNHMRYKLPDITCGHAVLQMAYREYRPLFRCPLEEVSSCGILERYAVEGRF